MDTLGLLPDLLEEFQNDEEFDGTFQDFLGLKGLCKANSRFPKGKKGLTNTEIEVLSSHVDEEGNII